MDPFHIQKSKNSFRRNLVLFLPIFAFVAVLASMLFLLRTIDPPDTYVLSTTSEGK